jgi:hypothetical protein
MAPKYHPTPLSGGDRKALAKELGKARAMANILATQSAETRAKGEALIQQANKLLCPSATSNARCCRLKSRSRCGQLNTSRNQTFRPRRMMWSRNSLQAGDMLEAASFGS